MDGWVRVLRPFNSISVISRRWKGEHERLCAMKRRLGSGRISPPAGFEPATPWSEVGSANRSATRTLLKVLGKGILTNMSLASYFWNLGKQCRPRSECSIWSLFADTNFYQEWNKNEKVPLCRPPLGLGDIVLAWVCPSQNRVHSVTWKLFKVSSWNFI